MFDALKNLGNLRDLMGKAQEMQQQMKTLQEEMAKRTVSVAGRRSGLVARTPAFGS